MTRGRCIVLGAVVLAGCPGEETVITDVTIIRGDDGVTWLDLTVTGDGASAPEGTAVIIQVGMPDRPPERLGIARTEIGGGTFQVVFPDVWEHSLYKRKTILLDADGDGACGDVDTLLVDYSAAVADTVLSAGELFPGECTEFVADWPSE